MTDAVLAPTMAVPDFTGMEVSHMNLDRERIIEALESMARQTAEGARRVEEGARMLNTSGDAAANIARGVSDARYHAAVMGEAARLLNEPVSPSE